MYVTYVGNIIKTTSNLQADVFRYDYCQLYGRTFAIQCLRILWFFTKIYMESVFVLKTNESNGMKSLLSLAWDSSLS